jgi:3-oxoacyl-[acyl-carrier-protein] synthase-1
MKPAAIVGSGMVTGVGLTAPSSCAAIRVGLTGFVETRFMFDAEWLIGCPVPLVEPWRGREKLVRMLTCAIRECVEGLPEWATNGLALLVCVAEPDRPGRLEGQDETLIVDLEERCGLRFHPASQIVAGGRVAGLEALERARALIADGVAGCVVAGADSLLSPTTLADYEKRRRLLTKTNSDGFLPGEAAAAVLVRPPGDGGTGELRCLGIGYGLETATIESGRPLRGEGLAQAFGAAIADAGVDWPSVDYQLSAVSGEQYGFKEAALAVSRTVRPVKHGFDLWHPSDCIGEVGAAIGPCLLAVAWAAARKGYAPGPGVLCHAANDDGRRAAAVLRWTSGNAS